MSRYEELRQEHLAQFMARLPEHIERLTWPLGRLEEERTMRLRALMAAAKERSPWHRDRLREIDPVTVDEAQLRHVPTMTKDDLMAHWDEIVTVDGVTLEAAEAHLTKITSDAYFAGTYHVVASGGSSGRRGVFLYNWEAWLLCHLGYVRHVLRQRLSDPELAGERLVAGVVAAEKPTHMTSAMAQTFSNPMVESHRLPVTLPLEEIVAGLNTVKPTAVMGYASVLGLLAHEARSGRLHIRPRNLIVTSEPLLPELRTLLEETWRCPVGNWWGTSEGGPTGVSCGAAPGMHLPDDLLIIEPVDANGQPVPPGTQSAKVYLTNLINPALPLIRYEVTDEVIPLDETCPCGSTHRRIADIQGRQDDIFLYAGAVHVHPITFRSPLGRERYITEYQVYQTTRGAEIRILCNGPVNLEALRGEIEHKLSQLGVTDPRVAIVAVPRFERGGTGKLRRFFPLPNPQ
jgi:phenylacetate-coenzyme A ligase PaaK-like adenylate-forming protein